MGERLEGTSTGVRNRYDVNQMTDPEKIITQVMQAIEPLPADPRLTRAVCALMDARNHFADFIDNIPEKPAVVAPPALGQSDEGRVVTDALIGQRGRIQQLLAEQGLHLTATLLRKNKDYGSSVFDPPDLDGSISPETGLLCRISDKVRRIRQLRSAPPEVAGESLNDSFRDLGGYSILWLVLQAVLKERKDEVPRDCKDGRVDVSPPVPGPVPTAGQGPSADDDRSS